MRNRKIVEVDGKKRFEGNRIVRHIFEVAKSGNRIDLNLIWSMYNSGMFSRKELKEFYQLIGYTVDGFQELFEFDHGISDS